LELDDLQGPFQSLPFYDSKKKRVGAGKVVSENPLLLPLLFAFYTMLAPAQQRRTLLYVLLPGTGAEFEHAEEMDEEQSWFWPRSGEITCAGARLIRQKQDQKKA